MTIFFLRAVARPYKPSLLSPLAKDILAGVFLAAFIGIIAVMT